VGHSSIYRIVETRGKYFLIIINACIAHFSEVTGRKLPKRLGLDCFKIRHDIIYTKASGKAVFYDIVSNAAFRPKSIGRKNLSVMERF
jgi:hypothetical protein